MLQAVGNSQPAVNNQEPGYDDDARNTGSVLRPREGVTFEEGSMKSALQQRAWTGDLLLQRRGSSLALAGALALIAAQNLHAQGGSLKPQIVERDGLSVIGIEVRTSNAEAATVIPRQWDRLFKDGIITRIPNRADANILAVYSRYASDHNGEYDYLIGARVKDGSQPPDGMAVRVIPKARYAVVTTAQGPVGKVVSETWQKIWGLEEAGELGGRRTYKADFELYDQRSRDPNNSQVDIYVAIE